MGCRTHTTSVASWGPIESPGLAPKLLRRTVEPPLCRRQVALEPLKPSGKKEWEAVRKAWEAVQPEFSTSGERVAQYKTAPFGTTHGPCTVATIANGKIK